MADQLADIKRNGYPCSSREFWWLVAEVDGLRTRLAAAQSKVQQLRALLREALSIVRSDANEWYEDASEGSNRRCQAASHDLATRIAVAADTQEENE